MDYQVRPVETDEREKWQALFRAYADFYRVELKDDAIDRVWSWIHDPDVNFWCAVAAMPNGTLIGMTQFQSMLRSLNGGNVCYLSDLYVDPDLRSGGVGHALIAHVRQFAADNDMGRVRWLTQSFNRDARRLYDRIAPASDFILYDVSAE